MSLKRSAASVRGQMSVLKWGIVSLTMVGCVWVGSLVHAEDQLAGVSNYAQMIGKPVKNPDGKNLGRIKDLVINWRSDGYIDYAVLSFGGFLGLGEEYVAVPWAALTPSENHDHFVWNVTEEHLKSAPGFMAYRFYDRSSVSVLRPSRANAQSAYVTKGDIGFDENVSVARLFSAQ
ncbi:MAG: hypothetical protein A4E19_19740 [Nitrospira sp. SG-bin1]|nr:MAG: hypothetical protein A4E19_19740 [Nitrospira sp. SG-bin1]